MMTLEEIKEEKKAAELQILQIIFNLQKKVGGEVLSCALSYADPIIKGHEPTLADIELELKVLKINVRC